MFLVSVCSAIDCVEWAWTVAMGRGAQTKRKSGLIVITSEMETKQQQQRNGKSVIENKLNFYLNDALDALLKCLTPKCIYVLNITQSNDVSCMRVVAFNSQFYISVSSIHFDLLASSQISNNENC